MAKRSSRKKKLHSRKSPEIGLYGTRINPEVIFRHEFQDIISLTEEQLEKKLQEVISILKDYLSRTNALSALSCLALYGVTGGLSDDGTTQKFYGPESTQSSIELLQALFLTIPVSDLSENPVTGDIIQGLFDNLELLSKIILMIRLTKIKNANSESPLLSLIQEELRQHTQQVRNWGYIEDVIAISKEIYSKIDDKFKEVFDFSFLNTIRFFEHLLKKYEFNINESFESISKLKGNNLKKIIYDFHKAYGVSEDAESMYALAKEKNLSVDEVRVILWAYHDSHMIFKSVFNLNEFSKQLNICHDELKNIVEEFSLSLGSLKDNNQEFLFLDNPVWLKPLIRVDEENYFCALPITFFSFILKALGELCKTSKPLSTSLSEARASYLEDKIVEIFTSSFPESECVKNYRWKDSENEYENDFLIKIDSALLIVEAKSHEVTWPALRGAEHRVKRHVLEMLYEPSIQSKRLEDKMIMVKNAKEEIENFPFSLDEIKSITRLSVTLDDFATLHTMIHRFKDIGWIPKSHIIAPCILLSDLGVIFHVLDERFHKLNYLQRRVALYETLNYKADEIDLLSLYLACGLNVHSEQVENAELILTGMSKPIDDYYTTLTSKTVTPTKPKPKLTRFWRSICKKLDERSIARWSEAISILLSVSYDEQQTLEKQYRKITQNVKSNYKKLGQQDSVVCHSKHHKKSAIVLYAFPQHDISLRRTKMENLAAQIFENPEIERCLVIAKNVDDKRKNYVYSTLIVFFQ